MQTNYASSTTYFVGTHYEVTGTQVNKYYYAGTQRIAMRKNGTLNYILGDHLGSTSLVTDASGVVINQTQYKAWGEERYSSGAKQTGYGYTGQYSYAADFGLQFYNARWYDSSLGRFTSADTVVPGAGNPEAWDRYAYTLNNPLRYTDPTGHRNCEEDGYNCPGNGKVSIALGRIKGWWTGTGVGYTGSGWGHGLRRLVAKAMNLPPITPNLNVLLIRSVLHEDQANITWPALDKVKSDPEIYTFETKLVEEAKSRPDYGVSDFSFSRNDEGGITFGGNRDPTNMLIQFLNPANPEYSETWDVAKNESSWMLRWASVKGDVSGDTQGKIIISYTVEDTLDLRPIEGRSFAYNAAVTILGFVYHDVIGANDKMKVYASWKTIR